MLKTETVEMTDLSIVASTFVRADPSHLGWKFMSCSHVKSWVNLLSWLLVGCSLLCSQSAGASLLVDPTLENDYNS